MRKRRIFLIAFLSICLFITVGAVHLVIKSCHYSTAPPAMMQQVKRDWQNGEVVKALLGFPAVIKVGLECGIRCQIAQPHIERMVMLERVEQVEEALAECGRASQALGGCDVEGTFDYLCNVLEMKLLLPSMLTPVPDTEP